MNALGHLTQSQLIENQEFFFFSFFFWGKMNVYVSIVHSVKRITRDKIAREYKMNNKNELKIYTRVTQVLG